MKTELLEAGWWEVAGILGENELSHARPLGVPGSFRARDENAIKDSVGDRISRERRDNGFVGAADGTRG